MTDSEAARPDPDARQSRGRAEKLRALIVGAILGGFLTIGFLAVIGVLLFRQTVPPLTRAKLDAAMQQWETKGPRNYNAEIEIFGNRPGKVTIEVRSGVVTKMLRDGVAPSQRRTWDYWSINGQFETIERELELAEAPQRSFGSDAAVPRVYALFHPELGYPQVYRRSVPGVDQEMAWKITRFEPLEF
jgi:hypothetical protein